MGHSIRELESEVLDLDPESRAKLARALIHSLESSSDEDIEKVWAQEALARAQELEKDPGSGIESGDVFAEARNIATK